MIDPKSIVHIENTEREVQRFLNRNSLFLSYDEAIIEAANAGFDDNPNINWGLFKHLLKQRNYISISPNHTPPVAS